MSNLSARWPDRLRFTISHEGDSAEVQTRLVGSHWANSAAAAIAVAHQEGLSLSAAASAIESVEPFYARLQPVTLPDGVTFLRDDVDPSWQSARIAFDIMKGARTKGRRIIVVSTLLDSGLSHTARSRQLATEAAKSCDMVVFMDHKKELRTKIEAAEAAGLSSDNIVALSSVKQVAEFCRDEFRSGDLVLLKGRTSDHLGRVFLFQTGEVNCWVDECRFRFPCEGCSQLT